MGRKASQTKEPEQRNGKKTHARQSSSQNYTIMNRFLAAAFVVGVVPAAVIFFYVQPSSTNKQLLHISDSGWAQDPDPLLLDKFLAAPCAIRRVDASTFPGRFPSDYDEPLILTNPKGGCGPRCAEAWRKDNFVKKFGDLPMVMGSQIGVAYFGPNTDDSHRQGWPQTLGETVETMDRLTVAAAERNLSLDDARDDYFAFDGSWKLLTEITKGTPNWEGKQGQWYPEQFADYTGRPILSMGPTRAGLPFHSHSATFLWLVHGYKHWFVLPPGPVPDGLPKPGQGHTIWQWLTESGALQLPNATGQFSEIRQCTQQPGEIFFLPKRWHHATLNIGIALAYGGQGERSAKPRTLPEIEKDIAAAPNNVGLLLEKASVLPGNKARFKILQEAQRQEPNNFEVWLNMVDVLVAEGNANHVQKKMQSIWKILERQEQHGLMSAQQISQVLGQLCGLIVEAKKTDANRGQLVDVAINYLQKAADRDNTNDYVLFYLGAALIVAHRLSEADAALSQCLVAKPNHARARTALDSMRKARKR